MFGLGIPELVLILVLALIIFGPNKLPEVGSALGKTIKEFKQSTKDVEKEVMEPLKEVEKEVIVPIKETVTLEK